VRASRVSLAMPVVLAVALVIAGPVRASPPGQPPDYLEIPGSPLRIQVGSDASVQVYHENYARGAAYGTGASGPYIAVGTDVYGPTVPAGPAVSPLAAAGNDILYGGSGNDVIRIVTTQRLSGSGADLTLVQTVSYADGNNYFQLDWQITNEGGGETCFKFYHAADLFFADDDWGIGYYDAATGAVGGSNQDEDWFMAFIPITPADHYREAHYSTIWADVSAAVDLDDTIDPEYIDNGAALQWDVCLESGESTTISDLWSFGESSVEVIPREVVQPGRPLGVVDVWVPDNPEDEGGVPSGQYNDAFWISPDIINRNQDDDSKDHQNPVSGQANYAYVQVRNRGQEDAEDVQVELYLADANLIAPQGRDSWNLIGSTIVPFVPAGGVVWTEAVLWDPGFTGHGCMLARVECEADPVTDEWNVAGDNNLAQRNVHIGRLRGSILGSSGSETVEGIVVGPPGPEEHYVEIIVQYPDVPPTVVVYIVMPPDLFRRWQNAGGTLSGGQIEGERIRATGPDETIIGGLPLDPGERAPIELEIEGPTEDPFLIGMVEEVDGDPVGGNVYVYEGLGPGDGGGGLPRWLPWAGAICGVGLLFVLLLVGVLLLRRRRQA
jgi:hypothetical protein